MTFKITFLFSNANPFSINFTVLNGSSTTALRYASMMRLGYNAVATTVTAVGKDF